jgi:hypothetical protein
MAILIVAEKCSSDSNTTKDATAKHQATNDEESHLLQGRICNKARIECNI